jgi:hypothetical protein
MYNSYTYYIYYKEANVYISSQEGRTNVICILCDISNVFVHTETDNGVRLNTNFDNKRDDLTISYEIPSVLRIYTVKSGKRLGSDRGEKTST